jgi:ketosteroid isomerase-like protein
MESATLREILSSAMSEENVEIAQGVRIPLRQTNATSQPRTLDERVAISFPSFYRLVAASLARLSPHSRLRQLLLARRVQQAYAAQTRRDYDAVLAGWDSECEYRPSRDLMPPDLEASFYGHDGMRRLWRYWRDAFEDIRWDPEEIEDFGDKILVTAQQLGHGSGSGVGLSKPVFQLFTLRAGLVVRQEDFMDRSAALEAAGLSE